MRRSIINRNNKLFSLLNYVIRRFDKRKRITLIFACLVMVFAGISEIFSIVSIIPFLTVITEPDNLWKIKYLKNIFLFFGINNLNFALIILSLLLIFISVATTFTRLLNIWINGRLAANVACEIGSEGYKNTLYQSYEKHLYSNSSNLIDGSTNQITRISDAFRDSLQFISSFFISLSIVIFLFVVDYKLAFIATTIIISAYSIFALTIRKRLFYNSKITADASRNLIKNLQESLGSIKDLIVGSYQKYYLDLYEKYHKPLRNKDMESLFISQFPRYMFESISIIIIVIFAIILKFTEGETNIIVKLGVFALAAQKLIPTFQLIYSSWARIKSNSAQIGLVLERVNLEKDIPSEIYESKLKKFILKKEIQLKNVSFKYGDSKIILDDVSFTINKGDKIGILGSTGSGKTTLLDVMMGLLPPTSGKLLIDGKDLYDSKNIQNVLKWWHSISFVPQNIFLSDKSIAENIAFGIEKKNIDIKLLNEVSKISQLKVFIDKSLDGFHTLVGERGLRISGGQKQRLGIARALYKKNKVLILDEATSALDFKTENLLIESINNLDKDITIIMVTHRLSTLNGCNKILNVNGGKVEVLNDSKFITNQEK